MARLTEKQERFCNEYLVDFHIQYAAIRAGYPAQSAHVAGSKLVKNGKIQARIAEIRAETSKHTGVSIERTVAHLAEMAWVDPSEMYNPETGELLPIHEMPMRIRRAIVSIEQDEQFDELTGKTVTVKKVKLAPREKASDMIMKHLGGYMEDNKQKAPKFEIIVDISDDDDEKQAPTTDDDIDDDI